MREVVEMVRAGGRYLEKRIGLEDPGNGNSPARRFFKATTGM
jgi:hypothetical protein